MSNATPNPREPLVVGETVSSESPKVELGKSKAVIAAVGGVVAAVGLLLPSVLADGAISLNEGFLLLFAVLGGAGVPGIGTYVTPTSVTRKV